VERVAGEEGLGIRDPGEELSLHVRSISDGTVINARERFQFSAHDLFPLALGFQAREQGLQALAARNGVDQPTLLRFDLQQFGLKPSSSVTDMLLSRLQPVEGPVDGGREDAVIQDVRQGGQDGAIDEIFADVGGVRTDRRPALVVVPAAVKSNALSAMGPRQRDERTAAGGAPRQPGQEVLGGQLR